MDPTISPHDHSYLVKTLGDPLRDGLTELVLRNPEDPIDYLAKFLRTYTKQKPEME